MIGNGCCDSTAPFLFSDYMAGPNEMLVCEVDGVPVYLDARWPPRSRDARS